MFTTRFVAFGNVLKGMMLAYLLAAPPSAESWLPVSLGVLTDLEGDTGVGTREGQQL